MSEAKDPAIKLFGKTIPVPEVHANGSGECSGAPAACSGPVVDDSIDQDRSSSSNSSVEADKDELGEKPTENKREDGGPPVSSEELTNPDGTS